MPEIAAAPSANLSALCLSPLAIIKTKTNTAAATKPIIANTNPLEPPPTGLDTELALDLDLDEFRFLGTFIFKKLLYRKIHICFHYLLFEHLHKKQANVSTCK